MALQLYHGSKYNFDKFSFKNYGKSNGLDAGFGLYFSDSKIDALTYGGIVYTCMVQLKNNISNDVVTFDKKILKVILEKLIEKIGVKKLNLNVDEKQLDNILDNKVIDLLKLESDTTIISNIIGELCKVIDGIGNIVFGILDKYGYNHTIDHNSPDFAYITHYIIYNIDQIQITNKEILDDKNHFEKI